MKKGGGSGALLHFFIIPFRFGFHLDYAIYGSWQLKQLINDPRDLLHTLGICSNTLHTQQVPVLAEIFHEGLN